MGETSRSSYERFWEHFWLFKMRKEGDVTLNQANSALWNHSKECHEGKLQVKDWETKILSSHKTSLARQTKEAFLISREGVENLLNCKSDYLSELILKHRNDILDGKAKEKRNRAPDDDSNNPLQNSNQYP